MDFGPTLQIKAHECLPNDRVADRELLSSTCWSCWAVRAGFVPQGMVASKLGAGVHAGLLFQGMALTLGVGTTSAYL